MIKARHIQGVKRLESLIKGEINDRKELVVVAKL